MNPASGLTTAVAMMRRWEPRAEIDALFDGMPYYLEMELRFLANMDWAWLVCDGMPELEAEVLCADALRRAVEMIKMALGIEERGVGGGEMDGIGASGSPHISMMEMENILGGEMGDGRWEMVS